MFLHYFNKKETNVKKIAELVYQKIIKNVNFFILNNSKVLKKDINTTFEISSIFLISIFIGSKFTKNKNDSLILQELMNLFSADLDYSFRLQGIGDMSIGKYVKFYIKKFYFRVSNYEKIFNNSDIKSFILFINNLKIFHDNVNRKSTIELLYNISNKLIYQSKNNRINPNLLSSLFN